MESMELKKELLEQIVGNVVRELLKNSREREKADGVIAVPVPGIRVSESDRMDTGKAGDIVYTKDLFDLEESPRLGCGIMEMDHTTFDWTLNYDEIDYIIEGTLSIIKNGKKVTAGPGEIILIPRGSSIQFQAKEQARFLYITYPADWANTTA